MYKLRAEIQAQYATFECFLSKWSYPKGSLNSMQKAAELAALIKKLAEQCDTGFALAVHIRYTRPSLFYETYKKDWSEHYSKNGYMLFDPTVRWGLENSGMINWNDLRAVDEVGVIAKSEEFGLANGVTYSTGTPDSRTMAGFTRSGPPFDSKELAQLSAIVDEIHQLTNGIETFGEAELNALRRLDLSEY